MENKKDLFTLFIETMSKFLWNFNTFFLDCERKFSELYNTNLFVKRPTDWFCNIRDSIYSYFDKSLKEPPYDCWSGMYQISDDNLSYYFHIKDIDSIKAFNDHNSFYNPFIHNAPNKKNICIISKFNTFFKVFFKTNSDIKDISICNRKFLSVFYNHPDLSDSIEIKIPDEMLLVDNELFNKAFVIRTLQTMNIFSPIDDKYTIKIMDSELDEYEINVGQYLHIKKDIFEIKSF
tara:strand:- start:31128 stop:31829 length:702 start_codon:yes stop_codon:yes gene_type:complete